MSRFLRIGTLSLATLVLFTFVFGQTAPKDPPKADAKADESLYAKLNRIVSYNGVDDPKATLTEVLDLLAANQNLTIDINVRAFRLEQVNEPGKFQLAEQEPIRAMKNVRLETILQKVLERVPVPSGATWTVRRDHLEITTNRAQQAEFYPPHPLNPLDDPDENKVPAVFPLIHAKFEKPRLDEALKELADRTDIAIILDLKGEEKDKPVVTAKFVNTPLDIAVKLLAEMSDLRTVTMGRTLFVTSAEKAKRLIKEQQPKINPMPGGFGVMGNLGALGFGGNLGALGFGGNLGAIGFGGGMLGIGGGKPGGM